MTYGAPADNWVGDHSAAPARKGIHGGLAAMLGVVLLFGGCIGGYLIGTGQQFFGAFAGAMSDPQAYVSIEAPTTVSEGETFEVVVIVEDTSMTDRQVIDVDFGGYMIDQCDILSTTPRPKSQYADSGFRSYSFHQPLAAGGRQEFRWTMTMRGEGRHFGNVTVYFDSFASAGAPLVLEVTSPGE